MPVVGTHRVRVVGQAPRQQGGHRPVGVPRRAGVESDARLGQSVSGAAADAAADEGLHAVLPQEARQGPVAAAVGVHHPAGDHRAVFHVVELELLRVAEVLEYLTVFISDCDFHDKCSSLFRPEFRQPPQPHRGPPHWRSAQSRPGQFPPPGQTA